jgi:hypothetical protein
MKIIKLLFKDGENTDEVITDYLPSPGEPIRYRDKYYVINESTKSIQIDHNGDVTIGYKMNQTEASLQKRIIL